MTIEASSRLVHRIFGDHGGFHRLRKRIIGIKAPPGIFDWLQGNFSGRRFPQLASRLIGLWWATIPDALLLLLVASAGLAFCFVRFPFIGGWFSSVVEEFFEDVAMKTVLNTILLLAALFDLAVLLLCVADRSGFAAATFVVAVRIGSIREAKFFLPSAAISSRLPFQT
jgi:hypothetical protein